MKPSLNHLILFCLVLVSVGLCSASIKHPMILFPGYGSTILKVDILNQTSFPDCPRNGSFLIYFSYDPNQDGFGELCTLQLLTVLFDSKTKVFSNIPGVTVSIPSFGNTSCTQDYGALFSFLESNGFTQNENILVAGYDWRSSPNIDLTEGHEFVSATKSLVENAFQKNNKTRVYLIGHSNGPIMLQYFLNSQSTSWKQTYIAGMISYAGNWPGQGICASLPWTGLSFCCDTLPASAPVLESWPSSYFSMPQAAIFGDKEILVSNLQTGKDYTANDYDQLWSDSGLKQAPVLFPLFNGLVTPLVFPNVTVFSFFGYDLNTAVGVTLKSLQQGQEPVDYFFRLGDGNQEDITNLSDLVWTNMECHSFQAIPLYKIDHVSIPVDPPVMQKTLAILTSPDVPLKPGCVLH